MQFDGGFFKAAPAGDRYTQWVSTKELLEKTKEWYGLDIKYSYYRKLIEHGFPRPLKKVSKGYAGGVEGQYPLFFTRIFNEIWKHRVEKFSLPDAISAALEVGKSYIQHDIDFYVVSAYAYFLRKKTWDTVMACQDQISVMTDHGLSDDDNYNKALEWLKKARDIEIKFNAGIPAIVMPMFQYTSFSFINEDGDRTASITEAQIIDVFHRLAMAGEDMDIHNTLAGMLEFITIVFNNEYAKSARHLLSILREQYPKPRPAWDIADELLEAFEDFRRLSLNFASV